MKFEFVVEDKTKTLSPKDEVMISSEVPKLYDKYNDARGSQIDDANTIRDAVYHRRKKDSKNWRSDMMLPDMYELSQTLKAHLWENTYSNPEGMFDVAGKTREAQALANVQKLSLVHAFDEMKIQSELDKAINDLVDIGEAVLFVGWENKTKQIRRYRTFADDVQDLIGGVVNSLSNDGSSLGGDGSGISSNAELNDSGDGQSLKQVQDDVTPDSAVGGGFIIENKVCFDGARVKHISPESFVFDINSKDNWDSCAKICRSLSSVDEIKSNKVYKLSKENEEFLETLIDNASDENYYNFSSKDADANKVSGDKVEILEYWGDFKLEDGTVLRNWLMTVAGRSCVIRFEPNPYVINPFICANLIEDPKTKRGISPLRVALVINEISSDILNRQLDALALITNPPYLAPKGSFSGQQEVSPGKIIEYDSALMTTSPVPLNFDSALQGWDFINFFKTTSESSTGVFKNMTGQNESANRTATEVNYTVGGQSVRLNMAVDMINQRIILPMVELVADLIANFRFGPEMINVNFKGRYEYIEMNDFIRQADYQYRYGDRKATQERKVRFKELFEVISSFAKVETVSQQVDWLECFKYALEQYGIENVETFLRSDGMVSQGMPH